MGEVKELIRNNINYFRPGYILTDKEFKMGIDINEVKQALSTLKLEQKGLEYKIWQLKGTLEEAQRSTLKCLVGLAFWNDEDDRGFIVVDTPSYQISKFRGSFVDPYNIPVLYFDKENMSLNIEQLYTRAVEADDVISAFIKEQQAIYRQIPINEFADKVDRLLREYITKLPKGNQEVDNA